MRSIVALALLLAIAAHAASTNAPAHKVAERVTPERAAITNSPVDGSVRQVVAWLNANAHDPASIEYVEWSTVLHGTNSTAVRCKYRAKNALGHRVISNTAFVFDDDGNVVGTVQQ